MPNTTALEVPLSVSTRAERPQWAWVVFGLYFISGATALAYEVLWARMLSLQFGVSIFGVVVTVVAFMAGLGAGSLLGLRWNNVSRPLLVFAILEALVAAIALALPALFRVSDGVLGSLIGESSLSLWYFLQSIAVFLVLFLPATALGLGFPLILRVLKGSGIALGKIYGVNALGGAIGALLPLSLLPQLGWVSSVYVIAALGIVVAVTAAVLALSFSFTVQDTSAVSTNDTATANPGARLLFLAYAGVGAAGLMLEIGWTRLYGMVLLRTEYVMAIILAVFIVGIGLGSIVVRRNAHQRWLTILPASGGIFAVLSLWGLPWLAEWAEAAEYDSLGSALFWQGLGIAFFTFPVTLVLGAWLPLLAERMREETGLVGARLYGVNSIGAAIGAALAGFVCIPLIGTPATVCFAAILLFVCGMTFSGVRVAWLAGLGIAVLAVPVADLPEASRLLPVALADTQDVFRYEDAVSITHVVERPDGQRLLLGDLQRMDASSDPTAVSAQRNQARLPLLLHPNPESVLFLGLGTGISASGSLLYPKLSRVGVELSSGAIEAAHTWFKAVNLGAMNEMNVVRDDARRFLRIDQGKYDVIVGDLFHPDLVGRSALLSLQQFERVKARLAENGLFVQWLALNQFDKTSLDVVLRTFRNVFPNAILFLDGFRLAMVGPEKAFLGAPAVLFNVQQLNEQQRDRLTGGEGVWTWLGRFFGPIPITQGPIQDEWAPYIEFRLPKVRFKNDFNLALLLAQLLEIRPRLPQAAQMLQVSHDDHEAFERSYTAVDLAARSWVASVEGRNGEAERLIRFSYTANPKDRWIGFNLADRMNATLPSAIASGVAKRDALLRILQVRPDHEGVLRELWALAEADGNTEEAVLYRNRIAAISPLSRDMRASVGDSKEE